MIKEKYNQINKWLESQDINQINFIVEKIGWHNNDDRLIGFRETIQWYKSLHFYEDESQWDYKKNKGLIDYFLGDKVATLEDIKKHMLNHIKPFEDGVEDARKEWIEEYGNDDEFEEDYTYEQCHSAGYAGIPEYYDVKRYWETLTKESLIDGVAGYHDEMDLDGHRQYWFSRAKVEPLIFSYFMSEKVTKEKLEEELCNSNDIDDELQGYYPPEEITLLTDEEVYKLVDEYSNKERLNNESRFNHMIEDIEKSFAEDSHFKDRVGRITAEKFMEKR